MKQEIEKILDEYNVEVWGLNKELASDALQRLFLSKSIELLEKIYKVDSAIRDAISKNISQLESELKALE